MIYTCTFTPSVDYTTYLPEFQGGKLNRSDEVYYYPGGKGINVSRVLQRLGIENRALGFAGGFTGDYIEQFLHDEGIQTDFIPTSEITRINVKIKSNVETELNGPGPTITRVAGQQLLERVQEMKSDDWFVLAGRIPQSISINFLKELATTCQERGVRFVVDTSGSALKELVQINPFLIKPNVDELGELFDTKITNKSEAFHYAKKLVEQGVKHVVVSMGGDGALLATKELSIMAEAPKGIVVNTVGAGDSLVSGFIASYSIEENAIKAFCYGVATGSATAFQSDLCRKADVEALLDQVKITSLNEEE